MRAKVVTEVVKGKAMWAMRAKVVTAFPRSVARMWRMARSGAGRVTTPISLLPLHNLQCSIRNGDGRGARSRATKNERQQGHDGHEGRGCD